jgi:hypothetical protein
MMRRDDGVTRSAEIMRRDETVSRDDEVTMTSGVTPAPGREKITRRDEIHVMRRDDEAMG